MPDKLRALISSVISEDVYDDANAHYAKLAKVPDEEQSAWTHQADKHRHTAAAASYLRAAGHDDLADEAERRAAGHQSDANALSQSMKSKYGVSVDRS